MTNKRSRRKKEQDNSTIQPAMSASSIDLQIESWRKRLLDLSKRNRLINCKIGSRGALEIVHPEPESIWQQLVVNNGRMSFAWKRELLDEEPDDSAPQLSLFLQDGEKEGTSAPREAREGLGATEPEQPRRSEMEECLASPFLRDDHLLTQVTDKALAGRLNRLSLNAKTAIAERGINILYLGFGLLRWYESLDSDVAFLSPLLLVPVQLDRTGPDAPWKVSLYEEEVLTNHCLRELLLANFRLELPEVPEEGFEAEGGRIAFQKTIADVVKAAESQSRWEVLDGAILGTFSFQKLAMWQDLGKNRSRVASHDLCRAIAGDHSASVSEVSELPSPRDFDDRIHPKDIHTILDSDSSQFEAILAAKAGMSLVLDGPPGTGKSQTIANIIGESLVSGKTVLFVSEKAAALAVVKRRLDECNLGDFCLECHSHKANKKEVIEELGRCLALPVEEYQDQSDALERLRTDRLQLNAYARALHRKNGALKISAHIAHGRLARLRVIRASRCPIYKALDIDSATLAEIVERLNELCAFRAVVREYARHPWQGCHLTSVALSLQEDIRQDFELLAETLVQATTAMGTLSQYGLLSSNPGKDDLQKALGILQKVLTFPDLPASWFAANPRKIAWQLVEQYSDQVRRQKLREEQIAAQMEELSSSHARRETLRSELTSFRDDASCKSEERLLADVSDRFSRWSIRLRALPPATVRLQLAWLKELAVEIVAIRLLVINIQAAVDEFSRLLGVRIAPAFNIGLLSKLISLGGILRQIGPLKAAWFNEEASIRLKAVAVNCQRDAVEANKRYQTLCMTMGPDAFGAEGESLASEATRFGPAWFRTWCRLTREWSRFVRSCKSIYLKAPPRRPSDLLAELSELKRYHEIIRRIQEEEKAHAADLVCDDSGNVQWQYFAAGNEAIDALLAVIKIPDKLRQALTTECGLDQAAIGSVTDRLSATMTELDRKVASLDRQFTILHDENGHSYLNLSSAAFLSRLQEAEEWMRGSAEALAPIVALLEEQSDVAVVDLPLCFAKLGEVRRLRERIDELEVCLTPANTKPLETEALIDPLMVETAHHVISFTDTYGDVPPPGPLRVVTDPKVRVSVQAASTELRTLFTGRSDRAWKTLQSCFPTTESVSSGITVDHTPLDQLALWLCEQAQAVDRLDEWVRFKENESALERLRVLPVLQEVLSGEISVEQAADAFLARFYRQWLDAVYIENKALRQFRIEDHEKLITSFRQLDSESITETYKRIRSSLLRNPNRPHSGMLSAPPTSELGLLMREVGKRRRHLPLRQLFGKLPTLLLRLKPCIMMSPLAVSTYLDSPDLSFDVVIFDEASQVRPFDAIGAIYRGTQLIIAGDQKQLPPTSFFDRMVSDDEYEDSEEEEVLEWMQDFESILDVSCSMGMPRKRLHWHYRSRREPLIAFSNQYFYGNSLATFPSPLDANGQTAVHFHHVPTGRWQPGSGGGNNPAEARETATLVFRAFEEHPHHSLGVITFNQRQQFAVLDELDRLRRTRPEMEEFFQEDREEPFFVKNLENVQGDERDRIIISVGYGYDDQGKFAMRFGPLNVQGGERRLNVAVTRAKHQVILVSSVHANDIDLSRTQSLGSRLLRSYIDYAERGIEALRSEIVEDGALPADSDFEIEVEDALRQKGFDVRRQVGCSGYRIDLAMVHPKQKGRYVLGIECDGASYHSSATARDRDRLRQSVLEDLGWKICRVWSTDWIRNPDRQVQRIIQAYEQAAGASDDVAVQSGKPSSKRQEKPILRVRSDGLENGKWANRFSSIDDVPSDVLGRIIIEILRRFGQTTTDELIRAVARELGFQRVGNRIAARIGKQVTDLIVKKTVRETSDGRLCGA